MHRTQWYLGLVAALFCAVGFGQSAQPLPADPDQNHSLLAQTRGYTIDIKCNGQDSNVIVNATDKVVLKINLVAGELAGVPHEVWVVGMNSSGVHGSFSYATKTWYLGWTHVYYSGPVFDWSAYVLDAQLPVESYTCYFGLDSNPNSVLEISNLVGYDFVTFQVVP